MGIIHLHEIGGKQALCSSLDHSGRIKYSTRVSGKDEIFSDYQRLQTAFGIQLDAAYIRQEKFNQIMKTRHIALQK